MKLGLSNDASISKRRNLVTSELYRAVLEAFPTPTVVVDVQGAILFVNARLCEFFEYGINELPGRQIELLLPSWSRCNHTFSARTNQSEPPATNASEILIGRRKSGSDILIEIHTNLINTSAGICTVAFIASRLNDAMIVSPSPESTTREISASRSAENIDEMLRCQNMELSRSNRELQQFAYAAAHDLQEPLRAITGLVDLLQRRYGERLDAKADEYIGHARNSVRYMQSLIDGLLALSRVDGYGTQLMAVECTDIVNLVLENMRPSIAECDARIEVKSLPTVLGNTVQLRQLFQNLLSNAVKFRRDETPLIRVGCERDNMEWRFAVSDNGVGIEPQYVEQIFGIFQRLNSRSQYSGTGIGLSLCKKIVSNHRGRIWVESEYGVGSTFYFTLPAM